jgi:hypothetical protein
MASLRPRLAGGFDKIVLSSCRNGENRRDMSSQEMRHYLGAHFFSDLGEVSTITSLGDRCSGFVR